MGFLWIKILNDFSNIFGWKCNCRQTFVSNIVNISRKRAIITNKGDCLENKILKLRFFLKISYQSVCKISGGITGIFLLFKKIFNRDQYTLQLFWIFISLFTVLWQYFSFAASIEAFRQVWRSFKRHFKSILLLLLW